MEENKGMCYACLYFSYLEAFRVLSVEEVGSLTLGILQYGLEGVEPEFEGLLLAFWIMIRGQLKRDRERYEHRCEVNRINGKKGGRPRKKPAEEATS